MEKLNKILELFLNQKTGSEKLKNDCVIVSAKNAVIVSQYYSKEIRQEVIAIRLESGVMLGNSSLLPILSAGLSSEKHGGRRGLEGIPFQVLLGQKMTMIPFAMFKQAGLTVSTYRELDKGSEETVKIKEYFDPKDRFEVKTKTEAESQFRYLAESQGLDVIEETLNIYEHHYNRDTWHGKCDVLRARHFTGSRLFTVGNDYFLLDIDRNEIDHGIFNPFLVKLNKPAKTISEAYQGLKPDAVLNAEKQGLKVRRQGEWFFIPTNLTPITVEDRGVLRAGRNRPNYTELFSPENNLVKGKIEHAGREHKEIVLESWHQAVANTSVESWQLSGDID